MGRLQRGYIYEACGAFYVRYYLSEIVDGQRRRVQRSERLCKKDEKYYAPNAKAVRLLRDKFILTINERPSDSVDQQEITVADFWDRMYLPFAEENLRTSTVDGYKQLWKQLLRVHFADMTLRQYRTHMGSLFLTSLAKKLGRRSLAHVRSLASGIFTYAVNTGFLETNPWHDVKILGKVRLPRPTLFYTLEEIEDIISALVGRPDCQLVIALGFFLGLRPGEIAGLQWGDIDSDWLHIRRAVVRGNVGECKTPESVASLPLIQPVKGILALWRQQSGNPTRAWVFPNKNNDPVDLRELARRVIIPALAAKNIPWKSLYACRRGAGTVLTQLTGSAIAAQQILRHKNLMVTTGFYVKQMPEAGLAGMKLLEAAADNGGDDGSHTRTDDR